MSLATPNFFIVTLYLQYNILKYNFLSSKKKCGWRFRATLSFQKFKEAENLLLQKKLCSKIEVNIYIMAATIKL